MQTRSATSGLNNATATGNKSKRKRNAKQAGPPVKGGWELPHGMGVGITGTSNAQAQQLEPASVLPPDTNTSNTQVLHQGQAAGAPQPVIQSQHNPPGQTRQTRLSLRITKVTTNSETSAKKANPLVIKAEERTDTLVNLDDHRLTKRVRLSRAAKQLATSALSPPNEKLGITSVGVETREVLNKDTLKLVLIKGVAIKDNAVVKVAGNIVVDASNLLDPNYRQMVKRGKENPYGLTPGFTPYPYRRVPTAAACEEVHKILTDLHGEVKQPEKMPAASLAVAGCGEVPCVLDALLRTLISGNTQMARANAAIRSLAEHYGLRKEGTGAGSIAWDKVRSSSHEELAQVIRVAGTGPKRSRHIKQILDMVHDEGVERSRTPPPGIAADPSKEAEATGTTAQNFLSLDHMHSMSKDEALAKFVTYPGIGIKTAACVTLFCLQMPSFAVDTHVHKFCQWLGWVPKKTDPDNCFRHGDFMVPDHLKYGLHQLFIRHGQTCFKCRKITKPGTKDWNEAPDCPLEHLLDRSKDDAGSTRKREVKTKKTRAEAVGSESGETTDEEEEIEDEEEEV
ncbi:DNA glycosylase [Chaetomium sp. MPI-SDFR-AT-0129]|nr:DNA glycosylase [Chaetomium sp. MPI-SDFR-AT-0129]